MARILSDMSTSISDFTKEQSAPGFSVMGGANEIPKIHKKVKAR